MFARPNLWAQGYGYYDRDDYHYGVADLRLARDFGFQDGSWVARQDIAKGKPYQPYPRGKYAHADRGYRSEYGDKYAYRAQYTRAYHEAYEQAFWRR